MSRFKISRSSSVNRTTYFFCMTQPSPPWLGLQPPSSSVHATLNHKCDKALVATGVFGEDYRALLRRSRVVFNRSLHGEENQRVAEAASCGALVLQERGNPEMEGHWLDG